MQNITNPLQFRREQFFHQIRNTQIELKFKEKRVFLHDQNFMEEINHQYQAQCHEQTFKQECYQMQQKHPQVKIMENLLQFHCDPNRDKYVSVSFQLLKKFYKTRWPGQYISINIQTQYIKKLIDLGHNLKAFSILKNIVRFSDVKYFIAILNYIDEGTTFDVSILQFMQYCVLRGDFVELYKIMKIFQYVQLGRNYLQIQEKPKTSQQTILRMKQSTNLVPQNLITQAQSDLYELFVLLSSYN
ncbi:hypothetical protein pb186bvf_004611 [Paramecium bursaria]